MSLPPLATLLRHRPPALLLDTIATAGEHTLSCTSRGDGPWQWPEMLEGAAQAAGLLAGLQPGGPSAEAVIAEYRDIAVHAPTHTGALAFQARLDRRLLHFWRCAVETRAADGRLLLAGLVTIAPGR